MLDVQIAVAKTNKYASLESGDTVEVVERPHGGFSVVLADGQGSGRAAKSISHLVTTKAVSMLKDGIRDGVVARSVHDYLYAYRGGKVSATLVILSVDLASRTLVLSRNSHCPVLLSRPSEDGVSVIEDPSQPIGIYARTKPSITELPLEANTCAITFSDGLLEAGKREGKSFDIPAVVSERLASGDITASSLANTLIEKALQLDSSRPADDMSVLVLSVLASPPHDMSRINPQVRRMELHIPL